MQNSSWTHWSFANRQWDPMQIPKTNRPSTTNYQNPIREDKRSQGIAREYHAIWSDQFDRINLMQTPFFMLHQNQNLIELQLHVQANQSWTE
jgi:hypothetical protein